MCKVWLIIIGLQNLTWYQSFNDQAVMSSNLTIPIYLIKKLSTSNVGLCKFQAQRAFTWGGVLENNINHILKPYLTA